MPWRGRRGTETRTSWARSCLRERVPDIATCFAGSGGFLRDSSYFCRPACSRFIYQHRGSGIYLSIAGDCDGDALRQHCWRPYLVRHRLGRGVLLLSSEVQLFYFWSAQCRGVGILSPARGDCEQGRCGRDEGRSRDKAAKVAPDRLVATAEEDRLTACTHKRADRSPVVGVMFADKARLRWLLPRLPTKSNLPLRAGVLPPQTMVSICFRAVVRSVRLV